MTVRTDRTPKVNQGKDGNGLVDEDPNPDDIQLGSSGLASRIASDDIIAMHNLCGSSQDIRIASDRILSNDNVKR